MSRSFLRTILTGSIAGDALNIGTVALPGFGGGQPLAGKVNQIGGSAVVPESGSLDLLMVGELGFLGRAVGPDDSYLQEGWQHAGTRPSFCDL